MSKKVKEDADARANGSQQPGDAGFGDSLHPQEYHPEDGLDHKKLSRRQYESELADLSYSAGSTPGTQKERAEWQRKVQWAHSW